MVTETYDLSRLIPSRIDGRETGENTPDNAGTSETDTLKAIAVVQQHQINSLLTRLDRQSSWITQGVRWTSAMMMSALALGAVGYRVADAEKKAAVERSRQEGHKLMQTIMRLQDENATLRNQPLRPVDRMPNMIFGQPNSEADHQKTSDPDYIY